MFQKYGLSLNLEQFHQINSGRKNIFENYQL